MTDIPFEALEEQVKNLSTLEKIKLVERIMETLKQEIRDEKPKMVRPSLAGLWEGVDISSEDIDEARRDR